MNKPVLWFLGVSVLANAVFAYLMLVRPAAPSASARPATENAALVSPASAAPSSAASRVGSVDAKGSPSPAASSHVTTADLAVRLRKARTDDEIRSAIADLRAAGVPANLIRAMVSELLRVRFAAREPTMPFWRRNNPTPQFVAATQALNAERRALLENLLGIDGAPAAAMDPQFRALRYGQLSDEKLNALLRVERDYEELRSKAFAETGNSIGRMNSTQQQQQLLEAEKLRDLAAILTPEELQQYELRNTASASAVMRNVAAIELNEQEFTALFRLQKELDAIPQPDPTNPDFSPFLARQAVQLAMHEKVRAVLGDDRFHRYLENADPNYSMLTRFTTQQPTMTPEKTYQLYQLQSELQRAVLAATQAARDGAQIKPPDVKSFDDRLIQLVGPDVAAAYKKQGNGRMFVSPPRTSGPGGG